MLKDAQLVRTKKLHKKELTYTKIQYNMMVSFDITSYSYIIHALIINSCKKRDKLSYRNIQKFKNYLLPV